MKKIDRKLNEYFSDALELKIKILYFLILLLKIVLFYPLIYIFMKDIIISGAVVDKFILLVKMNKFILNTLYLICAILISLVSTNTDFIDDITFLNDRMLISTNIKNNGDYEKVYSDKFKIYIGFNIICILPLAFLMALTISSVICLVFSLFPKISFMLTFIKYFLTLVLFKSILKTFNEPFIKYLKKKND